MKPKTFTYNEIIKFFLQNNMPLNERQVALIASKVRVELEQLEEYRKKVKAKKDADWIKRQKKKEERQQKLQKKF